MQKPKLFVMRGVPGAGKSTFLDQMRHPPVTVCSADHHFIQADGTYMFDATQLPVAHGDCFRKFSNLLEAKTSPLAVDNTNRNWKAMGRYVEAGLAAGYDVEVVDLQTPYKVAAARNVHGVPEAAVLKMACQTLEIPEHVRVNPSFTYTVKKCTHPWGATHVETDRWAWDIQELDPDSPYLSREALKGTTRYKAPFVARFKGFVENYSEAVVYLDATGTLAKFLKGVGCGVSSGHTLEVPTTVIRLLCSYYDKGGYAGLTISEYLKAMT